MADQHTVEDLAEAWKGGFTLVKEFDGKAPFYVITLNDKEGGLVTEVEGDTLDEAVEDALEFISNRDSDDED